MAFKTVTAALLAGGITLGAIVTWNGGQIIDDAQEMIQEQATNLNLFGQQAGQMKAKILEMRAELEHLYEFGTEKDQARIAELEQQIADAEAAVVSDSAAVQAHIEAQEAEMNAANTDAAELQTTMDEVGETPTAMTERELGELLDGIFVLPEGYTLLKMISGTPQIIEGTYGHLVVDKNQDVTNPEFIIRNGHTSKYIAILDGNAMDINANDQRSLGLVASLEGSQLVLTTASGTVLAKLYLSAE